jgi:hypothetical protein
MGKTIREDLYTSAEAEKYLGLSANTLANWRVQGKGPDFIKSGSYVRYLGSDLDFWLEISKESSR